MRYFYVIYVKDELLNNFINAIRLLSNPSEKHDCHITVRGPYSQPIEKRIYDIIIQKEIITIKSVGTFFGPSQNTVFLRCDSENLKKVWSKPDYDYNPHISLYDGKSRKFAEKLVRVLNSHLVNFSFKVDELHELVSIKGKIVEPITVDTTLSYLKRIVGNKLNRENITKLNEEERLLLIELLIEDLSLYKSKKRLLVSLSDQKTEKTRILKTVNYELFPENLNQSTVFDKKFFKYQPNKKKE